MHKIFAILDMIQDYIDVYCCGMALYWPYWVLFFSVAISLIAVYSTQLNGSHKWPKGKKKEKEKGGKKL